MNANNVNTQFELIVPSKKFNINNYSELQTGDILFFTGEYLFSKGTQFLSDSIWNHVGIVINMNEVLNTDSLGQKIPTKEGEFILKNHSKYFILESVIPNGVRLINFAKAGYRYEKEGPYNGRIGAARLNIEKPFDYLLKLRNYIFSAIGERYAYNELAEMGLEAYLNTYTRQHLAVKENPIPPFVCTELVYYLTKYTFGYTLKTKNNLLTPRYFSEDIKIKFLGEMEFTIPN
jgi:hypothetical protein